jgi:hypothetical protein
VTSSERRERRAASAFDRGGPLERHRRRLQTTATFMDMGISGE